MEKHFCYYRKFTYDKINNLELSEFYNWIGETNNRIKKFCVKPIFLDSKENAVPAYDYEGKLVLFLPTGEDNDYTTVNEKLLENEDIKAFLSSTIRITKPALKNEIYNKILLKFKKGGTFDSKTDFKKLFEFYMNECPPSEQKRYISELQNYAIDIKNHKNKTCLRTQVFYLFVRQAFQRILTGWMFIWLQIQDRFFFWFRSMRP
ncbi:MAG: hypothetical protein K2N73_02960 [Lachnospiraceae bacterium]|nr:hypothetical protein [Lachnospiraceae bacterium]